MNNKTANVAGVSENNSSRKNTGLDFIVGATMNIFSFWTIWALAQLTVSQPLYPPKHTTSNFLMHTHLHTYLLTVWYTFLVKFLFPLPPVNLTFCADFMETFSDSAELSTCFSSETLRLFCPSCQNKRSQHSARLQSRVMSMLRYISPGPEKILECITLRMDSCWDSVAHCPDGA